MGQSKQDVINKLMFTLCINTDTHFKTKYFNLIYTVSLYIYYRNFCIPHPCFNHTLIVRQSEGNMRLDSEQVNMVELAKVDEDFDMYIELRDKVKDALINLSNGADTRTFNKAIQVFLAEGIPIISCTHPFWVLYEKQKLINKLWS